MAGHVRKFTGIQLATSVGASGTITTKAVPSRFARMVVFLWKSTTNEAPASAACNYGESTTTLNANAVFFSGAGGGYAVRGNVGARLDQGGATFGLLNPDGKIMAQYTQGQLTAGAGGLAGVISCDAFVLYDSEADLARAEQVGLVEG